MKTIRLVFLIFASFILWSHSCKQDSAVESVSSNLFEEKDPVCPLNHSDSIIPVLYGFPTEESFAMADSGLIYLGGCILESHQWYCQKHDTLF